MTPYTPKHQSGTVQRYVNAYAHLVLNPGKYRKSEFSRTMRVSATLPTVLESLGYLRIDDTGKLCATRDALDAVESRGLRLNHTRERGPQLPLHPIVVDATRERKWALKLFGSIITLSIKRAT